MKTYKLPQGAYTALVTPFKENGHVDWSGYGKLIEFQISQGITGLVPVGTTGESCTLSEREHDRAISFAITTAGKDVFIIAGCGSNNTDEALHYVEWAAAHRAKAVLLVDCYYNGPSSLELRNEYYGPIAKEFPNVIIVPYIIPGRTGCKLFAEDLAALNREFPNICAFKEATGDEGMLNAKAIRALTLPGFQIFSGDDDRTFSMMTLEEIQSCGVISVTSNIAPAAVHTMCDALIRGQREKAEYVHKKLQPLFKVVTVFQSRTIPIPSVGGTKTVTDKVRNPVPIKAMMDVLGMPSGHGRRPLGKMDSSGIQQIRGALIKVWAESPDILQPIEEFFKVNIGDRLTDNKIWEKWVY